MDRRRRWTETLRAAAGLERPAPGSDEACRLVERFKDEMGARRACDGAFLAALCRTEPPEPGGPEPGEAELWRVAATGGGVETPPGDGPLVPDQRGVSMEAWSEAELCALHALWRIARTNRSDALRDRCFMAAAWHVAELGPDNATNTPWAIHVFVEHGLAQDQAASLVHAEMMLHNALVSGPDSRSRWVLLDAAMTIAQAG